MSSLISNVAPPPPLLHNELIYFLLFAFITNKSVMRKCFRQLVLTFTTQRSNFNSILQDLCENNLTKMNRYSSTSFFNSDFKKKDFLDNSMDMFNTRNITIF